jgi:hypothetical protein
MPNRVADYAALGRALDDLFLRLPITLLVIALVAYWVFA